MANEAKPTRCFDTFWQRWPHESGFAKTKCNYHVPLFLYISFNLGIRHWCGHLAAAFLHILSTFCFGGEDRPANNFRMAVHSRFSQAFKPDLKPDYLGYPDDKEILEDEMQAYMIEGNCSWAERSCVLILWGFTGLLRDSVVKDYINIVFPLARCFCAKRSESCAPVSGRWGLYEVGETECPLAGPEFKTVHKAHQSSRLVTSSSDVS